jgi:hypothetical protein
MIPTLLPLVEDSLPIKGNTLPARLSPRPVRAEALINFRRFKMCCIFFYFGWGYFNFILQKFSF